MIPYEKQWHILQTLPGVDAVSAAMLIVEIGVDMTRFSTVGHLASWIGICSGNNQSAGKQKSGKTVKSNPVIKRILCEIANASRTTNSQFKGKYQGLVIRRGHKRSIIALGHKILRTLYVMLRDNAPYRDPIVDYEALMVKKNAPRWIKALKKFGLLPKSQTPATA